MRHTVALGSTLVKTETFSLFLLWCEDPLSFCGLEKSITMENRST